MATANATWNYRDRHDGFARTYFRAFGDCVVSSVGVGTYLGEPTDTADGAYQEAVTEALESGVNLVDTAVNYRCQRSERVVDEAIEEAGVDREAVVVATKGGVLPFDGSPPENPGRYIREAYVEPGLVDPDGLVGGRHCLSPAFIDDQVDRSRSNLGLDTIDLYYLHNPETQLQECSREAVYDQLEAAFEVLERRVQAGDTRHYGVATWEAFRVEQGASSYLSVPAVVERARAAAETVGAATTNLRAIQLPFNVYMADAFTIKQAQGPFLSERPKGASREGIRAVSLMSQPRMREYMTGATRRPAFKRENKRVQSPSRRNWPVEPIGTGRAESNACGDWDRCGESSNAVEGSASPVGETGSLALHGASVSERSRAG